MTARIDNVYIDANIFIYLVEGHASVRSSLEAFADALDSRQLRGVTSELTIAEVLVKPIASTDKAYEQAYRALFSVGTLLKMVPNTRVVLERSAELRATIGGKLADSIHAATADLNSCATFLSEDKRIKLPPQVRLICLADFPQLLKAITET